VICRERQRRTSSQVFCGLRSACEKRTYSSDKADGFGYGVIVQCTMIKYMIFHA
jgi:hypothetical protein